MQSRLPHEELTRYMQSRNEQQAVSLVRPRPPFLLCRCRCRAAALASGPDSPGQDYPHGLANLVVNVGTSIPPGPWAVVSRPGWTWLCCCSLTKTSSVGSVLGSGTHQQSSSGAPPPLPPYLVAVDVSSEPSAGDELLSRLLPRICGRAALGVVSQTVHVGHAWG